MSAFSGLLRDIEATMARSTGDERAAVFSRLTDLFIQTAPDMDDQQVGVFDMVIGRLSRDIELQARIELAERLAPVARAPIGVVRQLALDDIAVARPLLIHSPRLTDEDLVSISTAKGQAHMLAITERPDLGERVTDFLILRGGRDVTHAVTANQTARFSRHGMGVLIMRSGQDDTLQMTLGLRQDLPPEFAEQLMVVAKNTARRRLKASLAPNMAGEIDIAVEIGAEAVSRRTTGDFLPISSVLSEVRKMHDAGELDEEMVRHYARQGATEHAVASLSLLAHFSPPTSEQVLLGSDRETILLVARGLGWSWETTAALISLRKDLGKSQASLDKARESFRTIPRDTAQRVTGFLRVRDGHA